LAGASSRAHLPQRLLGTTARTHLSTVIFSPPGSSGLCAVTAFACRLLCGCLSLDGRLTGFYFPCAAAALTPLLRYRCLHRCYVAAMSSSFHRHLRPAWTRVRGDAFLRNALGGSRCAMVPGSERESLADSVCLGHARGCSSGIAHAPAPSLGNDSLCFRASQPLAIRSLDHPPSFVPPECIFCSAACFLRFRHPRAR
jgi:hypothetical protein